MGFGPTRDLGPAVAVWGSTSIDEVFDEIRWTLTGESAMVTELLYGATPVDHVFMGYTECSVVLPATRMLVATLATLLPGAINSGGAGGAVVGLAKGASGPVGNSEFENGLPLFIKPVVAGVAAANGKWLRLERTYPVPNFDVVFNVADQRVYGLTFKAHPQEFTAGIGQLWSAGTVSTDTSYA